VETLAPILAKAPSKSMSALKKRYESMLFKLYESKFSRFLNQRKRIVDLDGGSMLDEALHRDVERDLNKLLEPGVMFTFAYHTL
jgi:hypothetical protein